MYFDVSPNIHEVSEHILVFYWLDLNSRSHTLGRGGRFIFHYVLAQMCIFLPFSDTFSVYLRPNVYIYVQMSILMSNGCGFCGGYKGFRDCRTSDSIRLGPSGRQSGLTGRIYPLFQ